MSAGAWLSGLNTWSATGLDALLRASWQGALALTLAWAVSAMAPRMSPSVRCWLWRLAYAKLLVALFWATPIDLPLLPAEAPAAPTAVTATSSRPRQPSPSPAAQPAPVSSPAPSTGSALLLVWGLGVVWGVGRVLRELLAARRLRSTCGDLTVEELHVCCADLSIRLGLQRGARLLVADGIGSPLVISGSNPAVVLPRCLVQECSPAELRWMLAHELAHLKRADLLWGWLPAAAHVLFWFHPLVWLADREWRLAQEMACDETAVRLTGAPVGDYGEVLVRVAARTRFVPQPGLTTAGGSESPVALKRRLAAMRHVGPGSVGRAAVTGSLLALIALPALVPWRVVAQERPAAPARPGAAAPTARPAVRVAASPARPEETRPEQAARPAAPKAAAANNDEKPAPRRAVPDAPRPSPARRPAALRDTSATAPPAPSAAPPIPVDAAPPAADDEVGQLLADIRSAEPFRRSHGAARLGMTEPVEPRPDVARALVQLLRDPDPFVRQRATRALALWGDLASVPPLIERMERDEAFAVQWAAMDALGKLGDVRAAPPLAGRVASGKDRAFAARALQELGPQAEPAAIRLLRERDGWARLEACKILKNIGSSACLPALREAAVDRDGLVAMAARDAVLAVQDRPR